MIMSHLFHHRQKIAFFLLYVFITSLASWQQPAYGQVRLADNYWTFRSGDLLFHGSGSQEKREIPVSVFMNADDHGDKERHIVSDKKPAPGFGTKKFIGGPNQPESQAFQSVNSNNMVDLFTGDFSYNIPLLDAGGYPIGLSYRSGISMDQEASWVGLGWNINPGSITRNVRGLPDDFNGTDSITKELNTKKKWTAGVNVGLSSEIFGKDLKFLKNSKPTIGIYYDNYTGPGFQASLTPGLNAGEFSKGSKTSGVGNFTLGVSFDSKSGFNVNPSYGVAVENIENARIYGKSTIGLNYNSRAGLQDLQINGSTRTTVVTQKNNRIGVNTIDNIPLFGSSISFSSPSFTPTITMPSSYVGFTFTAKGGTELFGWHPHGSITGTYSQNFIAPKDRVQKLPAYGYLNMSGSVRDNRALLDFNREKDIPYRKDVPTIAIPIQTYDVFSISGEGTGGSFRAYRGDVGIIHDHQMKTKSSSSNIGVDFGGPPNVAEFGTDVRFTYSTTENKKWEENNTIKNNLSFRNSDTTFESAYFRNPGEQTSNSTAYYQSIGDEDVVRINLTGTNFNPTASNILARFNKQRQTGTLTVNAPIVKSQRDKRSQVISYLSAYEASQIGFEKDIRSYNLNSIPLGNCDSSFEKIPRVDVNRKSHHISEITVLNPDGRRYIYGIPAYNLVQKEATFAVNQSDAVSDKGLVAYDKNRDVSSDNNKGKDGYFNLQTTPANAHSFLLTELLSTDYVDVTGNGISDDDIGDAVKFNYTRMKWSGETAFRWRAPINEDSASYDEGLRTDNSDDKGHFVYGEKEIWYLNSIESKTMIATFTLDTDSLRKDGFEVKGFHGGRSTSSTKKLMRLKEINLYSKADLKKSGNKARPIKTVHFVYSYRLCKGYPDLKDMNTGKLTLESVYFTYNGVKRGKENPYVFNYHSNNPNYKYKAYDRWGNYKQADDNPADIPVDEYPYAVKDSATAAANAGAWNLTEINLPSGAKMKVEYESDDYGFVQNRRAQEMFQIAGFSKGLADSASLSANLYSGISNDNKFVYVDVPVSVADKQDIQYKYLHDAGKLYFKLYTQMPEDGYGSGSEYIPVYAEIKNYGKVNSNRIWIELEASPEGNNKSPLATAAIQFLRLNLPSKAYRGSDVGNDPAFKAAIMAVLSIVPEASRLLTGGFNNNARLFNLAKTVTLSHSFVRLASPRIKKMGGGHRVKKITISDNWQKMADRKESVYGQEYAYTTTRTINGKQQQVSSGVASYEPLIGNEENPFRQPVEYKEKVTLAPSNFLMVEEPYAESLFPSAGVGYSKVRVSSINRKNIKSASGFEETEFYTAYDFPTITDMTSFDKNSYKKGIDVFKPFGVRSRKFITLSQGFKIELNDMHGKMKSSSVFSETDSLHPIFYSAQFYRSEKLNGESFKLVNKVPTILYPSGLVNNDGQIGKDIELIADMREQYSSVRAAGLEYNVNQFILPIPVFPLFLTIGSIIPDFHIENSRYRSAGLLKVIQRYGILDSVVVIDKGSKVSTRNLLWDEETGEVLATQTQNEFNDPVYQFNYPAYWAYSGMGPAYKNIDAVLQNVNISGGKVVSVSGGQIDNDVVNRLFESGDEILVMNTPMWFFPSVGCYPASVTGRPTRTSFEKRIWAVDRAKVTGGGKEIYFIDRNGNEFTAHGVYLRIVRSGRRNMSSIPVGSVTSLKVPFRNSDGHIPVPLIRIDSTINVLAASAAVMKDVWPVENRFDRITLCDSANKVIETSFLPSANGLVRRLTQRDISGERDIINETIEGASFFTSSRHRQNSRFFRETRGILQFDLNGIPNYATVDSARLNLNGKIPTNLWDNVSYWTNVSKAHTVNVNESELLRIIEPWNEATTIQQTDLISIPTNKVTLPASTSTCQDYQVNIKNMVQDMISDPSSNYGMLLKQTTGAGFETAPGALGVSHMSFCGSNFLLREESEESTLPCANCVSPSLYVKYHYRNDSCYTVCRSIFDGRINPYAQGIWGNWKMVRSYVYYDRRRESDPLVAADVRTAGVIKNFRPFWANLFTGEMFPSTNDTIWVWNNEVTRYNRRGLETENHDPLNRFNSALYGYSNTLPIAVAQNSRYREMTYDGFEDYSFAIDSCVSSCITPRHFDFSAYKDSMVTTQHHTGRASLRLRSGSQAIANSLIRIASDSVSPALSFTTGTSGSCTYFDKVKADSNATYPVFTPQPGQTMVLSAWVKEDKDCQCTSYTGNSIDVLFYHSGSLVRTVTRSPSGWIIEGWQRYQDSVSVPANADSMVVKLKNSTDVPVYFDDLRIHPFNSNMKSFVYHPVNLRLLAELDENNYASFYEYDDEGTLIRVKKETERGIKTIRETRSAMQKPGD
jgi:hypothetical protein